jgi:long-chain acyl-CoA synthetase
MSENLADRLIATVARNPEAPALKLGDATLNYAELDEMTGQLATFLAELGIEVGDRVGIMLPNVPEFAIAYYAVMRAGGVVVPMNVLLKEREVDFYLSDPEAKLLFAWNQFEAEARKGAEIAGTKCMVISPDGFGELLWGVAPRTAVAERAGSDTAVILYTSGTTGKPKGAELTHANLDSNAQVSLELFGLTADDIILGALPLFHAFGQTCTLNTAIASGATLVPVPRFNADKVLETIERDRVTVFAGVPTMFAALLHHPDREQFDTSSLRVCISGGAAMPVEILRGFEAAFGSIILEGYGLSETSPVASFSHLDRERKVGSIGTPVDGVEMRVVDSSRNEVAKGETGEIAIRGNNVMKGYWRRPEATAEAIDEQGWFYSGDIGRVDADGYFFIVDRKKELIIRGGYNVYPREIEEVLYEHPAVREAAVIGIPHPDLGEEIGAAVALKTGAEVSEDELRDFVKSRVAAYKYPRHVWFVDELPKGATGKILKREIRPPAALTQ